MLPPDVLAIPGVAETHAIIRQAQRVRLRVVQACSTGTETQCAVPEEVVNVAAVQASAQGWTANSGAASSPDHVAAKVCAAATIVPLVFCQSLAVLSVFVRYTAGSCRARARSSRSASTFPQVLTLMRRSPAALHPERLELLKRAANSLAAG